MIASIQQGEGQTDGSMQRVFLADIFPNISAQILAEFATTILASKNDIKLLLAMLAEPFSAKEVAAEVKSAQQLQAMIDSVPTNQFEETSLRRDEYPEWYGPLTMYHCDLVKLVVDQLQDPRFQGHFQFEPQIEYDAAGQRVYSSYVSSKHYEAMYYDVIVASGAMQGSVVAAVGLVSDATVTSLTGSITVHPIYAFLLNLSPAVRWKKGGLRLVGLLPQIGGTPPQKRQSSFRKDKLQARPATDMQ
jgi:hypothetical protein